MFLRLCSLCLSLALSVCLLIFISFLLSLCLSFFCPTLYLPFYLLSPSFQGVCDGACALIVASEEAVNQHKLTPLARVVGYGLAGVDPSIMGIGPAYAIRNLMEKVNMSLDQIDLVEVCVCVCVCVFVCVGWHRSRFNPDSLIMSVVQILPIQI